MKGKSIEERVKDYPDIRKEAQELYGSFKKIHSPALGGDIHFTSEGFNHLIYERARKERDKRTQILRFDMLERAKFILETSTTYQEYEESLRQIWKKKFKKMVQESALMHYWGFVAIINNFRIKVIARQIGNGGKHFWSVIPAWTTSYYRDIKLLSQSTGNLEEN